MLKQSLATEGRRRTPTQQAGGGRSGGSGAHHLLQLLLIGDAAEDGIPLGNATVLISRTNLTPSHDGVGTHRTHAEATTDHRRLLEQLAVDAFPVPGATGGTVADQHLGALVRCVGLRHRLPTEAQRLAVAR